MNKLECAAHTILAIMDVLSTVFKTREHTAHVRVVGTSLRVKTKYIDVGSAVINSSSNSVMPEKIPLTIVQKLAQPKRYTQHIPVTPRTTIVRVHLSQRRLPKIT
jgi:hypothetical protein